MTLHGMTHHRQTMNTQVATIAKASKQACKCPKGTSHTKAAKSCHHCASPLSPGSSKKRPNRNKARHKGHFSRMLRPKQKKGGQQKTELAVLA